MKVIYQKGDRPQIVLNLSEERDNAGKLESVTILYRNEADLDEIEPLMWERLNIWKDARTGAINVKN